MLVLWGRQGTLPPHSRRTTSGLVEGSTRRVTVRAGVGARLGAEQKAACERARRWWAAEMADAGKCSEGQRLCKYVLV